mmetsp:Transcript_85178/g.237772  ORF Transcript_85178/g.237772 Transcript_85178/m.237772 type:complete len:270 (+) Transcript_85178:93-902(+)
MKESRHAVGGHELAQSPDVVLGGVAHAAQVAVREIPPLLFLRRARTLESLDARNILILRRVRSGLDHVIVRSRPLQRWTPSDASITRAAIAVHCADTSHAVHLAHVTAPIRNASHAAAHVAPAHLQGHHGALPQEVHKSCEEVDVVLRRIVLAAAVGVAILGPGLLPGARLSLAIFEEVRQIVLRRRPYPALVPGRRIRVEAQACLEIRDERLEEPHVVPRRVANSGTLRVTIKVPLLPGAFLGLLNLLDRRNKGFHRNARTGKLAAAD